MSNDMQQIVAEGFMEFLSNYHADAGTAEAEASQGNPFYAYVVNQMGINRDGIMHMNFSHILAFNPQLADAIRKVRF